MIGNAVENALRGHRAERQLREVAAFEIFRDAIVKRPKGAALELFMAWIAELLNRTVNVAGGECLAVHKVDEEIRRTVAADFRLLVKLNPFAHIIPVRNYAGDSIRQDTGKVRHDVRGVAASQLDIGREAKIFTDKHAIANAHAGGECFIMRITQAKHNLAIRAIDIGTLEGEAAKVTLATTGKGMFFYADFQTCASNSFAGKLNKREVRDGGEGLGFIGSLHAHELLGIDFVFGDDE